MGRNHSILIPHLQAVRESYLSGEPISTIAARYGVTASAIDYQARRMNLPRRLRSTGDLPQTAIVTAYQNGKTAPQIASELGIRYHNIIVRILRSRGVAIRGGRAAANPDVVATAVRLYRRGMFQREIAARLGLSVRQVQYRLRKAMPPAGADGSEGRRRRWGRHRARKSGRTA